MSSEALGAYQKAQQAKNRRQPPRDGRQPSRGGNRKRKNHWFLLQPGDKGKEVASKLFTQFAALVLAACVVIWIDDITASWANSHLNGNLQDLYNNLTGSSGNGELLPAAQQLLATNPDTVGWVKIDGTKVDLPVVQRKGDPDGNEYYLTRNFNGNKAKAGTVFLDFRATLDASQQSHNLVLYAHNEKDNTMFGDLDEYKNKIDFYREHPVVQFNSNYEQGTYKIFGMFVTTVLSKQSRDGRVFDYHNYVDMDKARAKDFLDNVMERTQVLTTVDVSPSDYFLTLSTCSNEFEPSRFVIVARKLRKGEDPSVDVAGAVKNEKALKPDLNYIYGL